MGDLAQELIQAYLDGTHLRPFLQKLSDWLITDLNKSEEPVPEFTESRAKALMRASGVIDDPTLHDFMRLMETDTAVRCALYDLLSDSGMEEDPDVTALAATTGALTVGEQPKLAWPALAIAGFAWKSNYPLFQLDPASPPGEYSPAGQVVKRAASWMRQQVQRSATERDKLARKLGHDPNTAVSHAPTLEQLPEQQPIVAAPPHYRPPIPVNYPEVARETLHVDSDESEEETNFPVTSPRAQIVITEDDLDVIPAQPTARPVLRITHEQIEAATPPPRPVRQSSSGSNSSMGTAVQRKYGRSEKLTNTRLRVIVQEVQDGPGLYGVQVHIECRGVRANVAGTTNRNGVLLCELPVRVHSGLTYDIDVTWPREFGGHVERKSITLHADKSEFVLPFYVRIS
jgi:hypothetical protein